MEIDIKKQYQNDLKKEPFKRQVVYESSERIIDTATGEILADKNIQKIKTTGEPDFIKIYYKSMLAIQGIEELPLEFMLALSSVITYSNNPKAPVYFYNNAMNRKLISACCMNKKGEPISDNMVSRHISAAVKLSILFKVEGMKGVYEVNPCVVAKGRWENIRGLQANFDFTNGKWCRTVIEEPQTPEIETKTAEDKAS